MVRLTARRRSAMVRLAGRIRYARLPAVAAVLVVVERALVGEVGPPATLLRALPGHGDTWADPAVAVLALMALVAETLIGYVLVMLAPGGHAGCRASASSARASRVRGFTATRIVGKSLMRARFMVSPTFSGHRSP